MALALSERAEAKCMCQKCPKSIYLPVKGANYLCIVGGDIMGGVVRPFIQDLKTAKGPLIGPDCGGRSALD